MERPFLAARLGGLGRGLLWVRRLGAGRDDGQHGRRCLGGDGRRPLLWGFYGRGFLMLLGDGLGVVHTVLLLGVLHWETGLQLGHQVLQGDALLLHLPHDGVPLQ